ncbi:hypothetical protein [Myroides sp. DW712]|uniref:hypothetical protein n=1 Tax=Myroides sp. DW712 TaxID=3389800 RepID=UPI0039795751
MDDTYIPSYIQVSKEEKQLLQGDWRLINYSNTEEESIDLTRKGLFVRYTFTIDGRVIIVNESEKPVGSTSNAYYLTASGTMDYAFAYIKSWDEEVAKKERLHFESSYDGNPNLQFDMEITKDQLVLTHYNGDKLVFEKMKEGVTYLKIPAETKALLIGKWQLQEISDFTGRKRVLNENEVVEYDFGYNEWLSVNNKSAQKDGVFDQYIKMRLSPYSYRFDFEWEEKEVLYIDDLGSYTMGISQNQLILAVSDGVILKLNRLK